MAGGSRRGHADHGALNLSAATAVCVLPRRLHGSGLGLGWGWTRSARPGLNPAPSPCRVLVTPYICLNSETHCTPDGLPAPRKSCILTRINAE